MLPAARLKPVPFLEPGRLVALLEEDPSLLEAGLTVVARNLPFPAAGSGARLDLLAVDASSRIAAITVSELATGRTLESCLAVREWLRANYKTIRAMVPALSGVGGAEIRSLILAGHVAPAARSFAGQLAAPRPELYEVQLFTSPTGPAVSMERVRPRGVAEGIPEAPAVPAEAGEAGIQAAGGDLLTGIPLSQEEAEEFRKLWEDRPARAAGPRETVPEAAPRTGGATPAPGGFMEN